MSEPLSSAELRLFDKHGTGGADSYWAARLRATVSARDTRIAKLEAAVRKLSERAGIVVGNIEDAGDEGDAVGFLATAIAEARAVLPQEVGSCRCEDGSGVSCAWCRSQGRT